MLSDSLMARIHEYTVTLGRLMYLQVLETWLC